LSPHRLGGGRATWLIGVAPDLDRLARTQPPPPWTEIHRGPWARAGRALAAAEAASGLELAPVLGGDSVTWAGEGFGEFAAGAPGGVGRPGRALPPGGLPRRGERGHRRDAAVSRTRRRLTRPGLGAALRTAGAAAGQPAAEPARPAAVPAPSVPHGGRSGHALALGHGVLDAPPAGAVRPRGAKPCCGGGGRYAVVDGPRVRSGAARRGGRPAR